MKYRFAYSGNKEFYLDFATMKELRSFLKKVPDWELKNSVTIKWIKGIAYVGAYVRDNRIIVFKPTNNSTPQ